MKRCPKCHSSRVRRGYAHDPLIVRLFGYRELLCDSCNLRFKGFVLPGTLPRSGRDTAKPDKQKQLRTSKREPSRGSGKPARSTPSLEPSSTRCPGCDSDRIHRSHRLGISERIASALGIYPYRCDECNSRFLARRRSSA